MEDYVEETHKERAECKVEIAVVQQEEEYNMLDIDFWRRMEFGVLHPLTLYPCASYYM